MKIYHKKPNSQEECRYRTNLYFTLPFNVFAPVVVSLPLVSLFICFITSVLFKFEKVNETVCGVSNFIPSISAVTGMPPQSYVWRICIAFHSTPRLMISVMYYNYWMSFLNHVNDKLSQPSVTVYRCFVVLNCVLNVIENLSLVGVTYISNVDNYPLHEKIFICFMITSCTYMIATLVLYSKARQFRQLNEWELKSYRIKKLFLITILTSTAGLLFYFYKHRVLCEPNAFSWFSACEYGIAVTNMGFHLTAAYDFKGLRFFASIFPSSDDVALETDQCPADIHKEHNSTADTNSYTNKNGVRKRNGINH